MLSKQISAVTVAMVIYHMEMFILVTNSLVAAALPSAYLICNVAMVTVSVMMAARKLPCKKCTVCRLLCKSFHGNIPVTYTW